MDERIGFGLTNFVERGGVLDVCLCLVDGRSRYLYIVLGEYMRMLGAFSVHPCLLPTVYLFMADIENIDLFACGCRTCSCLDISRSYKEQ